MTLLFASRFSSTAGIHSSGKQTLFITNDLSFLPLISVFLFMAVFPPNGKCFNQSYVFKCWKMAILYEYIILSIGYLIIYREGGYWVM